jgi:hypothetical protein
VQDTQGGAVLQLHWSNSGSSNMTYPFCRSSAALGVSRMSNKHGQVATAAAAAVPYCRHCCRSVGSPYVSSNTRTLLNHPPEGALCNCSTPSASVISLTLQVLRTCTTQCSVAHGVSVCKWKDAWIELVCCPRPTHKRCRQGYSRYMMFEGVGGNAVCMGTLLFCKLKHPPAHTACGRRRPKPANVAQVAGLSMC